MKGEGDNGNLPIRQVYSKEKNNLPGYPLYPSNEDIYSKSHEEKNIDPEDISRVKESNENEEVGSNNEKNYKDDVSGSDLDVPGAELDDVQEDVGSEDEENNYYSLGGDDHDDLDEDKGERKTHAYN